MEKLKEVVIELENMFVAVIVEKILLPAHWILVRTFYVYITLYLRFV